MLKQILVRMVMWNLTTKILFLFLINAGAALYIEQVSEGFLKKIGKEIHAITTEDIPLTKIVTRITIHQLEQAIHFERASKYAEILASDQQYRESFNAELAAFNKLDKKVEAELAEANDLIEDVLARETDPLILAAFNRAKTVLADVEETHKEYSEHAQEAFDLFEAAKLDAAHKLGTKIEQEEDFLDKALAGLATEIEDFTQKSLELVEQHEKEAEEQVWQTLIIALSISGSLSLVIIVGVAIPIARMKGMLDKLAGGFSAKTPKSLPGSEMGYIFDAIARIGNNLDAINNTQGVVQYDPDGMIIIANDLYLDVSGYKLADLVGKPFNIFLDQGAANDPEQKNLWQRLGRGESVQGEFRRRNKAGHDQWFYLVYNPILDSRGNVSRITEFSTDITAEVKDRHKQEMISLVASKTDNSVVITDANERIEYINEGFTRLTGYSFDEAIGKKPGELLQGKQTDPETRAEIRRCIDAQEPFYNEILNYAKDGSPYWISLAINPVFDDNGKLKRFVSIQGDVTRNKMIALENERGMNESVDVLGELSHGDLRHRMAGVYDGTFATIQTAINNTIDNLISTTSEIKEMSESVSDAAREIASGSDDLSHRTEHQASTLEETAASVEVLTNKIRENTEHAVEANELSQATNKIASQGGQVVSEAVTAMHEIQTSSKKIADIIGTIDEIAFQTNLLALNAAVEAARAGEAGNGFAVVAQEVRALAGRSSQASEEIRVLIGTSVEQIDTGVDLVNQSGESLKEIVDSVGNIAGLIRNITLASKEQALGIEEVNTAVGDLDQVTQQNAALVEESTAAAQSMTEQARRLAELVNFFKTEDDGQGRVQQLTDGRRRR